MIELRIATSFDTKARQENFENVTVSDAEAGKILAALLSKMDYKERDKWVSDHSVVRVPVQ